MGEDYLIHHGVQGQKWGKQNGPPYPLNPVKDYSAAEKKANPSLIRKAKEKLEKSLEVKKKNAAEIKAAKVQAKAKMKADIEKAKQQEKINKIKAKYAEKTNEKVKEIKNQPTEKATKQEQKAKAKEEVTRTEAEAARKAIIKNILSDPTPEKIMQNRSILSTQQIQDARAKMEELDRIQSRITPAKEEKVKRFIFKTLENTAYSSAQRILPTAIEAGTIYAMSKSELPAMKAVASALKDQRKNSNKNKNNNNN